MVELFSENQAVMTDVVLYFHLCIFIALHCNILLFCLLWERLWKVRTRISNQSTCEWDCLSLMIFHLVCHFPRSFLSFSLSLFFPDCSVTVWALNIADWSGPGGPGSQPPYVCLHLSFNLSLLVAQHWESLLMNLQLYQKISFYSPYLPPCPQRGGGRSRINQSPLSQWHTPS